MRLTNARSVISVTRGPSGHRATACLIVEAAPFGKYQTIDGVGATLAYQGLWLELVPLAALIVLDGYCQ
jgi:hypothetical protein